MKYTLYILMFFLFIGCDKQERYLVLMDQAEDKLNVFESDSVVFFLDQIESPHLLDKKGKARYDYIRASVDIRRSKMNGADSILLQAAEVFRELNDSVYLSRSLHQAVYPFLYNGKNDMVDSLLNVALSYAVEDNLRDKLSLLLYNTFFRQKKYKESIEGYHRLVTHNASFPERYILWGNIGQAYRQEGKADSAVVYFQKAVDFARISEDNYHVQFYYGLLSEVWKEKGDVEKAIEVFRENIAYKKTRRGVPAYLYSQGMLFIAQGQIDSARVYLRYAGQNNDAYIAALAYKQLALLYEKEGDGNQAFSAWQSYGLNRENIYSNVSMEAMSKKYEKEKHRNEINELKLKKNRQDIYLLVLGLSVVLLCGAGYVFYAREHKKKMIRDQKELDRQIIQLEQEKELSLLRERAAALREELFRKLSASHKIPSLAGISETGIEKSRLTDQEVEEIVNMVNNIWPRFAERLQEAYPLLRLKDISFCCLIKAGITTKDLATIYYVTASAISQKKARMKRDKFGLADDQSLDSFLADF